MEILLIDDDASVRLMLSSSLRENGHRVTVGIDGVDGMRKLREHRYDLVVTDVGMPGHDGFEILEYAHKSRQATDCVLMASHASIGDAISAIKHSASDYLVKPIEPCELSVCVARIEERQGLNARVVQADADVDQHGLVGVCAGIARVRSQIDAMGPSTAPVLITGASGTGKELVARALHQSSARRHGSFVAINCASFPHTLLEAELFGFKSGAFTGATSSRAGRFAAAKGGTLFLDEISEMPPVCQAKLLRVLQEEVFSPLGTNESVALDARIISATNRPLRKLVGTREFREDLYYRVKVLTIEVLGLRERAGDLVPLCIHFLKKFSESNRPLTISRDAWGLLATYEFPGNVRELEHVIQHAVVLASAAKSETIEIDHLPSELTTVWQQQSRASQPHLQSLSSAAKGFERQYLVRALAMCNGNKTRASKVLSISRKNLWEKLRGHGISDTEVAQEISAMATPAECTSSRA
tara:strand:- start:10316 stop:11728 length:1413 start_codon:yes stop_codon:yes gene_type:complete